MVEEQNCRVVCILMPHHKKYILSKNQNKVCGEPALSINNNLFSDLMNISIKCQNRLNCFRGIGILNKTVTVSVNFLY